LGCGRGYLVDISFDNLDHALLLKAVNKHTSNKWIILYITRWLKAPLQLQDGSMQERACGLPQGGVISPVLSNLFLHYVFDVWMKTHYPTMPWCRYADDGLVHCKTQQQARQLLAVLEQRFNKCGLELHPDKTKIIYCKDVKRKGIYPNMQFNFLGYCFRTRSAKNRATGKMFSSFTPAVSKEAQKSMRAKIRAMNLRNRADLSLDQISEMCNPVLRGWIAYYTKYCRSALDFVLRHFNNTIVTWIMRKYAKFKGRKTRARRLLVDISKRNPSLFVHWKTSVEVGFA